MPDLFADSTMQYRYNGSGLNYVGLKWTTASGAQTNRAFPDGSGRSALSFSANGGQLDKTMTYQNSWWVGFRCYIEGNLGNFGNIYSITAAGEATLGTVTIEHDQTLSLRAGNGSGSVLFNTGSLSSPVTIQGNTSYYIEIGVTTSGGSATTPIVIAMSLKVNGVQMGSGFYSGSSPYNTSQTLNGTNTVNDHIFFGFGTIDGFSYFRDFYISDSANAPYGDVSLGVIFPYSDVVADFTPVGATPNFNCVNDTYPDINDDTIYIQDNNPGDKDSYLFGPLTGSVPIPFVHFCVFHKKDAEGTRTFSLTVNGTDVSVAPISSGDDYRYNTQGFDEQPGGGNWTVATFNATNFGVDIKT
jgi:hypothetical protein